MGQVVRFSALGLGGIQPPPPSVIPMHPLALAEAGLFSAIANLANALAKLAAAPAAMPAGAEIIVEGREILCDLISTQLDMRRLEGDDGEARIVAASLRDLHLRVRRWEDICFGR